jgi:hypothetical protein
MASCYILVSNFPFFTIINFTFFWCVYCYSIDITFRPNLLWTSL